MTHFFRPQLQSLDDRITPSFSLANHQTFTADWYTQSVTSADLNGDGRPDLVTANDENHSISVLVNTTPANAKTATFSPTQNFAGWSLTYSIAVADVNGDGRPDLLASNSESLSVSVLLNTTPTGVSKLSFTDQQVFAVGATPKALVVKDVNGDGRADIITANSGTNTISVLLNTMPAGAMSSSFATQQTLTVFTNPTGLAVEDLNGDGRPDIVTSSVAMDQVSVLLNTTASGASTTAFSKPVLFNVGDSPYSVAIADLNSDGRPDLITSNYTSKNVSVLLNTMSIGASTPSFTAAQAYAVGTNPYSVAAVDVNGDGRPDLMTANYLASTASVMLNTTEIGAATARFTAPTSYTVGSFPTHISAADLNADGRPDLFTANNSSNTVSVLMNNTPDLVATSAASPVAQLGNTGIWTYYRPGNSWLQLTAANATALATDKNGNTVASFSSSGVWYYRPSGGWMMLNGNAAASVAIDQFGNPYVSFAGYGIYRYRFDIHNWSQLGTTRATADQLAVSANGDVIANFPGYGLYRYRSTGWQMINGYNPTTMTVDANGFVIASFNGFGVGQYIPYANGWRSLTFGTATSVATDGSGNVFAGFAGFGLARWNFATNTWTSVAPSSVGVTSLAADLFGNLSFAVPGYGVWEYSPITGLVQRRTLDGVLLSLAQ